MWGGNVHIYDGEDTRDSQHTRGNLRIKTLRITIKNDIHATPSRRGYYGMIGTKVYSYNRHGLLVIVILVGWGCALQKWQKLCGPKTPKISIEALSWKLLLGWSFILSQWIPLEELHSESCKIRWSFIQTVSLLYCTYVIMRADEGTAGSSSANRR